jgi:hypothetical protein
MYKNDYLELQENRQEPITRPKLKRLILEYLQKRSRKELIREAMINDSDDIVDRF